MEAMIDNGEEWMIPLLEFRDRLAATQDPAVKPGKMNTVAAMGASRPTRRAASSTAPTMLEFSRSMLRDLLQTEQAIQAHDPGFQLIGADELREIRRLWITERQDWSDSLPAIYAEVTGRKLDWEISDIATPGELEVEILAAVAAQEAVPLRLVQKLIDVEWQHYGMRRRGSIHKAIAKTLAERSASARRGAGRCAARSGGRTRSTRQSLWK